MTRLAQALTDIGAPEAARYSVEADAYKEDLRDAVIRAYQRATVVKLRDNTYVPYMPNSVYQRIRHLGPIHIAYNSRFPNKVAPIFVNSIEREVYAGPMLLFRRDIFDANEPLADWLLERDALRRHPGKAVYLTKPQKVSSLTTEGIILLRNFGQRIRAVTHRRGR